MANTLQVKRGTKANLPALGAGEIGLCTDTNEVYIGNSGNVKLETRLTRILRGVVTDPNGYHTNVDTIVPIWIAIDAAITITSIKVWCDANPTTELDLDLKWADNLIGLANAAVVDVCDTLDGYRTITSGFDDATVAAGKCLYWSFGAAPDAAMKWFAFEIQFTYD